MTAQIIYGTDFKAKAEKERGVALSESSDGWTFNEQESTWSWSSTDPVPFTAPDKDPA